MVKTLKMPIITLISVFVTFITLIVLWISIVVTQANYTQLYQEDISYFSKGLAAATADSVGYGELSERDKALVRGQLSTYRYVNSITFYTAQYDLIETFGDAPETLASGPIPPQGVTLIDGKVTSHQFIGDSLYPEGYIIVTANIEASVSKATRALLLRILPISLVLWLVIIALSIYAIKRLFKPLASLNAFTQEVLQTKDFALRHHYDNKGELGLLAGNINHLLEMIEVELLINYEQNQTLVDQQETMTRLANFDSLTGLPNRQFVLDNLRLELARAKRNDEDLILLFFDLDGFKGINDSLGHETGDLILIEVADRVSGLLREGDLVARLGGDEFLVLPDRDTRDGNIESVAVRLINSFSEPFALRGLSLTVGVSIGIARAADANYDLSELMSNADLAMYRSKARGRGSYTIFTPDMVESHKRKLHIANAIEQGLREGQFIVYYQVKVDRSRKVTGLEALLRWQHPEFGFIMPNEFIPIAEQGGKISSITQWVIQQVCHDLPTIQEWINGRFRVSINLSGHDLRNSKLFDSIHETFITSRVNPEFVEFEVTESAYLENFITSNRFFKRLSNMGCAISLDDFGTGYSSLSYLTQISIDTLKIDKQFVSDLANSERSRLVTGAIIDLAKRLSLTVCAEGIENEMQWKYMCEHGCDYVQGFMFSKPVPLETLIESPLQYPDFIATDA